MTLGLLLTALGFGLRHGIDWDHIAAIADLSSAAENRRRGFVLSMMYALGHGAVVFGLGVLAIVSGSAIPDSVDVWMGRVVGVTLVALGVWILVELVRKGRAFRLRSRWMLVISGTFAGLRKVTSRRISATSEQRRIQLHHEHTHPHSSVGPDDHEQTHAHDHAHLETAHLETASVPAGAGHRHTSKGWLARSTTHEHSHGHAHQLVLPDRADVHYGNNTAAGIGMLHGIGIESPTQIAIFVASTSAAGATFGLALLGAWVLGLVLANAALALAAGAGLLHAEKSFGLYAALAVFVGVMSIAMGGLYLFGLDILPALA